MWGSAVEVLFGKRYLHSMLENDRGYREKIIQSQQSMQGDGRGGALKEGGQGRPHGDDS